MRSSYRTVVVLSVFLIALVLLRQGLVIAIERVPALERQVRTTQQQNIDPSALFYTESRVALRAIRETEEKLR